MKEPYYLPSDFVKEWAVDKKYTEIQTFYLWTENVVWFTTAFNYHELVTPTEIEDWLYKVYRILNFEVKWVYYKSPTEFSKAVTAEKERYTNSAFMIDIFAHESDIKLNLYHDFAAVTCFVRRYDNKMCWVVGVFKDMQLVDKESNIKLAWADLEEMVGGVIINEGHKLVYQYTKEEEQWAADNGYIDNRYRFDLRKK